MTPTTDRARVEELLPVIQADRDAVQAFHRLRLDKLMAAIKDKKAGARLGEDEVDAGDLVQAFARHRLAHPQSGDVGAVLANPNAVHINMLRGGIAKPSVRQIIHLYGEDAIRAALPNPDAPPQADSTDAARRSALEEEIRQQVINTPETADFMAGVPLEAAHQRERWGVDHDGGKTPFDWFWLIGYLAQKAAQAQVAGDSEKALHHTISTAAALANWHAQIAGRTNMRPGIGPDNGGQKPGSAHDLASALAAGEPA